MQQTHTPETAQQYVYESRYASSPAEVQGMNTEQLRQQFLIQDLFVPNQFRWTMSFFDRYLTGGILPVSESCPLVPPDQLKAAYFLERRELGVINVGGPGRIIADGTMYDLSYKEALYLGKGTRAVEFSSMDDEAPARFYLNSTPAHQTYPNRKIARADANQLNLGGSDTANERTINQMLINQVLPTCQLQMGMTELKTGSVWNTMPAHVHDRRMEVYFYFEVPEGQAVCHLMGEPQETRHIWVHNEEAVISPNWSIHAGAGTSNYTFIWGMAGENLDYGDMDFCAIQDLR